MESFFFLPTKKKIENHINEEKGEKKLEEKLFFSVKCRIISAEIKKQKKWQKINLKTKKIQKQTTINVYHRK